MSVYVNVCRINLYLFFATLVHLLPENYFGFLKQDYVKLTFCATGAAHMFWEQHHCGKYKSQSCNHLSDVDDSKQNSSLHNNDVT